MNFDREQGLEHELHREWRQLRERGSLSAVLPACHTRQWVHPDQGTLGYVTLDYQVIHGLRVPGAGRISLLEHYWSIRTLNGPQAAGWLPSLNVNVVALEQESLTVRHAESVIRNALSIRSAYRLALQQRFDGYDAKVMLYVRAVLLGPEMTGEAEVLSAMGGMMEIPLSMARYRASEQGELSFIAPDGANRFAESAPSDAADLTSLGNSLVAGDRLVTTDGMWNGTNTGPIFDSQTGLTIHNGRVL